LRGTGFQNRLFPTQWMLRARVPPQDPG